MGVWSSPAYWQDYVYYWGENDHLEAFQLVNGLLSTATPTQSTEEYGFAGATPAISANGTTDGIVRSNGTTLTLMLIDTITNASFTTSTAINIPATVGANTAYVGFTVGTGGLTATQSNLELDLRCELGTAIIWPSTPQIVGRGRDAA